MYIQTFYLLIGLILPMYHPLVIQAPLAVEQRWHYQQYLLLPELVTHGLARTVLPVRNNFR